MWFILGIRLDYEYLKFSLAIEYVYDSISEVVIEYGLIESSISFEVIQ